MIRVNPLHQAIGLLLSDGYKSRNFKYEPQLRLFQFKYWLLTKGPTRTVFNHGALIYSLLLFDMFFRKRRLRSSSLLGSERILLTLIQNRFASVLNNALPRGLYAGGGYIGELFNIEYNLFDENSEEDVGAHINGLNQLTEVRVRLGKYITERPESKLQNSIVNAVRLLARSNLGDKYKETRIKEIQRERKDREAFLLAAKLCKTNEFNLTSFGRLECYDDRSRDTIMDVIDRELLLMKNNKMYFSKAKSILELIDPDEYVNFAELWPKLKSDAIAEILPVSEQELEAADLHPKARRSSRETKRSVRQRPFRPDFSGQS